MRKFLLAAAATAALAAPAMARDGSGYVGIEGGLLFPRDANGNAFVDFTSTPATPAGPADFGYGNAFDSELKRGIDVDVIGGYDFGAFRLEGELGWKKAKRDGFDPESGFLTQLNAGLNRPSVAPDPGAPNQAALTQADFNEFDGKVSVKSAMVNALADFGDESGMSFYGGVGFGRAWAKALNDSDKAWAWQGILGLRTAVSDNIDLGLKYRYFRTGTMHFVGGPIAFGGNANVVGAGIQTTNAVIIPGIDGKFRSHSLLASLTFNFGAPEAAPAPVIAPPPPPPPAPATQTCPDGSVILATDVCPAPPPPPPPAPAGERG